ncbi:MAG: SpaA isopeptide-forming pilin-related protein [Flavobacterium sp.]
MKKLSFLFLSLVALISTTFVSCGGDSNDPPATPVTSLELTITDSETGAIISGAEVKLYDSPTSTTPVQTLTSDGNGKVKFSNLKNNIVYEFDATLGCKTNYFTKKKADGTLTAGTTTKYDVQLANTGIILLKNTSTTDTYGLEIAPKANPTQKISIGDIQANQQGPLPVPIGEYTITATNKTDTTVPVKTFDAAPTCSTTATVDVSL